MEGVELIRHYFPAFSEQQYKQFAELQALYMHWNEQINVISRKDMDQFYVRHVLHSLGIHHVMPFADGSHILDIGTGGGFPGIPLAIANPNSEFHLVDSIGKKIKVVKEVSQALGLENVRATHERAEKINEKFDFIVSRAVTAMPDFLKWTRNKFLAENKNQLANGILYLKGGDLSEEMKGIRNEIRYYELNKIFNKDFFETKKVVYLKA